APGERLAPVDADPVAAGALRAVHRHVRGLDELERAVLRVEGAEAEARRDADRVRRLDRRADALGEREPAVDRAAREQHAGLAAALPQPLDEAAARLGVDVERARRAPEDLLLGVAEDLLRPAAPLGDPAREVRRDEDVRGLAHDGAQPGVLRAKRLELGVAVI